MYSCSTPCDLIKMCIQSLKNAHLKECMFSVKDTGLNVGTDDVSCYVKINTDKFTLKKKREELSVFIQ